MIEVVLGEVEASAKAITVIAGALAILLTYVFKIFALYERHWSRRYHKILKELRSAESDSTSLNQYLDHAIFLEGFRISSGIRTTRLKADFLIRLALKGRWTNREIRHIARFLVIKPKHPVPEVQLNKLHAVEAVVSMFFGVLFFLVGAALGLAIVIIGKTAGALFAGCGLLCLYTLLAAFVLSGFNRYSTARRFKKEADCYPELFTDAYDSQGRP